MKVASLVSMLCISSLLAFLKAQQQPPTPPTVPPSAEAKRPDLPTLEPDPTEPEQKILRGC
jgi:hypothetical protein